ncbi:MAG: deoxyribodipyrimidine photo-lyase [Desulforhopalus sp.]
MADGKRGQGPVVYWMSRDQRAVDNWALLWAQQQATERRKGLLVVFCMITDYPGATFPHYLFMLKGLEILRGTLKRLNIEFTVLQGSPEKILPPFLHQIDAHVLVSDFDPLTIKQQWKEQLMKKLAVPFYEVDTHNIIPAWITSDKKEYAAYTIRPKIQRLLDDYLTDIPTITRNPFKSGSVSCEVDFDLLIKSVKDRQNHRDNWCEPGEHAAQKAAESAVEHTLANYPSERNNPCVAGQSGLSPYLHFGHLSAQRLAWLVSEAEIAREAKKTFLEELIVRKELADNFCLYEPSYDSFAGFPQWARKTLNEHRDDRRDHLYSFREFEEGQTHEELWNACQYDLTRSGKLHGYLRMYWAKKILEWTPDPETALRYAITLNDRYSLDGRDPNGYAGIAWAIGGVHDRAWRDRPVFGKVRYMNEAGCRRKFDVDGYIRSVRSEKAD